MVVDDNDLVRDLVVEILEMAEFDVVHATTGRDALEIVAQDSVDCVLLDYFMPEMNGPEVLAKLKEMNPDLHVIAMSAQPVSAGDYLSEKMGFDGYLRKPFMPDQLVEIVTAALKSADSH